MSIKAEKKKRGPYSAIFTKQSWLIKDLLHSKKDFSALRMKNDLFISRERKESQPFFFWLNKATGVFSVFSFFFTVCCRLFDSSLKFSKNYENCMSLGNFYFSFFFSGQSPAVEGEAHLARSGSQSEHRLRSFNFIITTKWQRSRTNRL